MMGAEVVVVLNRRASVGNTHQTSSPALAVSFEWDNLVSNARLVAPTLVARRLGIAELMGPADALGQALQKIGPHREPLQAGGTSLRNKLKPSRPAEHALMPAASRACLGTSMRGFTRQGVLDAAVVWPSPRIPRTSKTTDSACCCTAASTGTLPYRTAPSPNSQLVG